MNTLPATDTTLLPGAPAQKAAPAKKPAGTEYVVLRLGNGPSVWDAVEGTLQAANAHDAVRKASDGKPGVYIAVPARSWQPVTVTVETVTRVKLEDA